MLNHNSDLAIAYTDTENAHSYLGFRKGFLSTIIDSSSKASQQITQVFVGANTKFVFKKKLYELTFTYISVSFL